MAVVSAEKLRREIKMGDDVLSTLQEGRQAYLAVHSDGGPHVTPELYSWSSGRLWFAAAATTLKAKVLRKHTSCAAVVSAGGRSVLLRGHAESFDLRHPVELARRACQLPQVPGGLATYMVRNAPDLLSFVTDTLSGRLGLRIPPVRVLHALTPTAGLVVENDVVLDGWGSWTATGPTSSPTSEIAPGGEPVVAALPGPVAAPARWFGEESVLHVAPGLVAAVGALPGRFPLSIVRDEYVRPGPAAKEGELLRGHGHVLPGEPGAIRVELARAIEWHGTETVAQDL